MYKMANEISAVNACVYSLLVMSYSFISCGILTVKFFIHKEDEHAGFCVTNLSIYFYYRSVQYVAAEERKTFHLHIVACSPLPNSDREKTVPTASPTHREMLETVFSLRSVPRGYHWDKFRVQFSSVMRRLPAVNGVKEEAVEFPLLKPLRGNN
jgi:hypothetical protein